MATHEAFNIKNAAPGTYDFTLSQGGLYEFAAVATWGGGNVALNQLGPDGQTYLSIATALLANGGAMYYLPPGSYQFVVTTATAVYACVSRAPLD